MFFLIAFTVALICLAAAFVALPQAWLRAIGQRQTTDSYGRPVPPPPSSDAALPTPWGSMAWLVLAIVVLVAAFIGYPSVNVWQRGMAGQAQLAEAEANRQIKVREAQAEKDSASLLAEAEVIRAEGVKKANEIIADGLGGPEGYIRYLYIQGLKEADKNGAAKLIYVPTEGGLPITEAGRLTRGKD